MAKNHSSNALSVRCTSLDFGKVISTTGRDEFLRRLNSAVTDLVRSLPRSIQADAIMFILSYAGLRIGDELNFFRGYYSPIWSSLYWIMRLCDNDHPVREMAGQAIEAHALAMMLHSLDDHINDGEVSATHLTLLLRSQAWMFMHRLLDRLASAIPSGVELVSNCLDDYYAGIRSESDVEDLAGYCAKFEKQMATGLIVPSIMARLAEVLNPVQNGLEAGVRASLVRFGTAWRLLDDIRDLEEDMKSSRKTAVYYALPEKGRMLWECTVSEPHETRMTIVTNIIFEEGIIESLVKKITTELLNAEAIAREAGLQGLAEEYKALAEPLLKQ